MSGIIVKHGQKSSYFGVQQTRVATSKVEGYFERQFFMKVCCGKTTASIFVRTFTIEMIELTVKRSLKSFRGKSVYSDDERLQNK